VVCCSAWASQVVGVGSSGFSNGNACGRHSAEDEGLGPVDVD